MEKMPGLIGRDIKEMPLQAEEHWFVDAGFRCPLMNQSPCMEHSSWSSPGEGGMFLRPSSALMGMEQKP